MEGGGAYGAGKAGGPFDPIAFIKKPQVILRLVSWVSKIVMHDLAYFKCMTLLYLCHNHCLNNQNIYP